MFSQFMPIARIRSSQAHRYVQEGRRPTPSRRNRERIRARFQLEGLEDRCLLSGISATTNFPTPTQGTGPNPTWGITTGPDGNLWFTENSFSKIGMINPTTDAISEFATPTASAGPRGITAGPDGNLWFTENAASKIGMINPTTGVITEFATPASTSDPQDITAGPDGNLWFTENGANKIGVINPTTKTITEFKVPTKNSGPWGITAGPDGNIWFTEEVANKIGEINPETHAITEFTIPFSESAPEEVAVGPDGNLWFGAAGRSSLGMMNLSTHVITEFLVGNAGPTGITAGPDGNLWFTEGQSSDTNIGRVNTTTDAITLYPEELPIFRPWMITTGPDGNLWFTEVRAQSSVGVATLNSSQLVVTQPPPATITAGSSFGLTVTAEDSSGNPVTSFDGTVTVALANDTNNCCSATLDGTLAVTASNGVATFSGLTISNTTAGYYYSLYASGGGYGWGVTNTITVTAAAPTQLAITEQPPSTVKVNSGFGLQASIEDQYGNVVTSDTNTVTVAFANNPTGATLSGTLSAAASQGVATFSGLKINKTGTGYTLQVTSSGLSSAVSSAIDVTKTGEAILAPPAQIGTTAPDALLTPLVLDSPDLWDIPRLKKRARTI